MARTRVNHGRHGNLPRGIVRVSRFPTELDLQKMPLQPEYRGPGLASPAPDVPLDEAIAEMVANDEEFREWQSQERLAESFTPTGRQR